MLRRLALLFVTCFCVSLASGQNPADYPKFEFYGGYLAAGEFPYNEFQFPDDVHAEGDFGSKRAFGLSGIRNFGQHLGVRGEFSAQFHHIEGQGLFQVPCGTTTCPTQQLLKVDPKLFNFLAGPEYKVRNHTRYTPFGYALFGVAHTTANFSSHGSALNLDSSTSETGFSAAVGLGLDVLLSRHLSWRTQVDINPKYVGLDDNRSRIWLHDLRFSCGVVVH